MTEISSVALAPAPATTRTYEVTTYGCQMNVHDSERLSGLLDGAGYVPAPDGEQADVVVFNTCAVRENADNRLYGNLGRLARVKEERPGMQIAVGGCIDRKSTRLNSSHVSTSYAGFCLKKKIQRGVKHERPAETDRV